MAIFIRYNKFTVKSYLVGKEYETMKNLFRRVISTAAAALFAVANVNAGSVEELHASAADQSFESYLNAQGFPESYKPYLRELHEENPNWIFTAQHTGLDWSYVLDEECLLGRNLVHAEAPDSWKSCEKGAYDPLNNYWYGLDGTWVAASREIIAYYLDPRNFINDDYIFMFENQSYNPDVHTISGVRAILNGTFMSESFTTPDTYWTYDYAQTFMDAAAASGVSPYHLASRCRNEQGVNGAPQSLGTVKGFENYFNFFDIQAYYTSTMTAGEMACLFAQSEDPDYMLPWTNQYKSIVGGSIYLGDGYINKEQDTLYLQKFDVFDGGNGLFYHQYMTCVFGQANEALEMRNAYSDDVLASALEFKIPVYDNMPSDPCVSPSSSESSNNNLLYRFDAITPDGTDMLMDFYRYTYTYDFSVGSDVSYLMLYPFTYSDEATVSGAGYVALDYGKNTIYVTVTAGSGAKRTYTLNVTRAKAKKYKKGDVNGDGVVDVVDSLRIMNYASGKSSFSDDELSRADVDGSGTVDVRDALRIMQYVSGKISKL